MIVSKCKAGLSPKFYNSARDRRSEGVGRLGVLMAERMLDDTLLKTVSGRNEGVRRGKMVWVRGAG